MLCQLEQGRSPYSDEQKRLTPLCLLPGNSNGEQMYFNGMHTYSSNESLVDIVELEVQQLKERATTKFQSTANVVQDKPKAKNGKVRKGRKLLSLGSREMKGDLLRRRRLGMGRSHRKRSRATLIVINMASPITSPVTAHRRRWYTTVTTLHLFVARV